MNMRLALAGLSLAAGLSAFAAAAAADVKPLVVQVDQSQILGLDRPADTVVIGNPSIADASVQGPRLFVHGRSFGTTNLIVLDDKGTEIGNYELTVQLGGRYNVSVFKAGSEYSYVCAPDCEAQMHVGDEFNWFRQTVFDRNKDKITLATGQKASEVNPPPEPNQ